MFKFATESVIGIIANPSSLENRNEIAATFGRPSNGFFPDSMKFTFKEINGEVVPLDFLPEAIQGASGFASAKSSMFNAVEYLVNDRHAKVVCFTASTKRLPGKFGQDIKARYPNTIFTIGDNSTMISFAAQMNHFLGPMDKKNDIVVCLGAGFLGNKAVRTFLHHGFEKIYLLTEQKLRFPSNVIIINSLDKLPTNIKFLAGCSHKYHLDEKTFKDLLAPSAVIIDVSVPPVVRHEVYQTLPESIRHFHAGDYYVEDVDYDFPPELLKFPALHHWYGCFTEALILDSALRDGNNLSEYNFFEINSKNEALCYGYLKQFQVQIKLINFFNPIDQGTVTF